MPKNNLTPKEIEELDRMINDFKSGWIANPSAKADKVRERYERLLIKIRQICQEK